MKKFLVRLHTIWESVLHYGYVLVTVWKGTVLHAINSKKLKRRQENLCCVQDEKYKNENKNGTCTTVSTHISTLTQSNWSADEYFSRFIFLSTNIVSIFPLQNSPVF